MPVLPGNKNFITSEETEFEAPASEATMQRIGESINFLNNIVSGFQLYTSGSGTFIVPQGVTRLIVTGSGGGGGGGGGLMRSGPGAVNRVHGGGEGGSGGHSSTEIIQVTPGQSISYIVGSGGGGGAGGLASNWTSSAQIVYGSNGGNGGNTTFGALFWRGGKRGRACATTSDWDNSGLPVTDPGATVTGVGYNGAPGGLNFETLQVSEDGKPTAWKNGGLKGTVAQVGATWGVGGGGGGASRFAPGGNAGNGSNENNPSGPQLNGVAGSLGSGGGGGGCAIRTTTTNGGNGGAGGAGFIRIAW
jgi:hypothetical protein